MGHAGQQPRTGYVCSSIGSCLIRGKDMHVKKHCTIAALMVSSLHNICCARINSSITAMPCTEMNDLGSFHARKINLNSFRL